MDSIHPNMSHGDTNSGIYLGIMLSYYWHTPIRHPLGLSCWFQIAALDKIILNWSSWISSACMFSDGKNSSRCS
jgi:hypothetical protein